MRSRLLVVVGVTVAALTLGWATPAQADTLTAGCTTTQGDGKLRRLSAWAYYTPQGATNHWYQFQYQLSGEDIGDQSNVNIWIHEGGVIRWSYFSPDSLDDGILYTTNTSVTTNAASDEYARFEAIFDRWLAPDPRCTARTQSI